MADTLTTFTDFIVKPSAPFAAGVVLFGAVWGFFKGVESVLNGDTKLEIAVWLLDVKATEKRRGWPDTFTKVFDRIVGARHFSWKCVMRSAIASLIIFFGLFSLSHLSLLWNWHEVAFLSAGAVTSDYTSLFATRLFLGVLRRHPRQTAILVLVDFVLSISFAIFCFTLSDALYVTLRAFWIGTVNLPSEIYRRMALFFSTQVLGVLRNLPEWLYPFTLFDQGPLGPNLRKLSSFCVSSLVTSFPLWLYVLGGFLLKGARPFDRGLHWFISKADIEKHPLSSIGLVAGSLVALVYWTAVIVSRII